MSSGSRTPPSPAGTRAAAPVRPADRRAAGLLATAALLSILIVLHHPTIQGRHGAADFAAGIAAIGPALRVVHGALLVLLGVQALGFFQLSARLGWNRLPVAAGFLAYAAGVMVLAIPALLDGFVAPDLAAACVRTVAGATAGAAPACGAADGATFRLVGTIVQDFTKAGFVAIAVATAAWAVALLAGAAEDAFARAAGAVGLLCAAAPIAFLLGTDVLLRPTTLAGFVAAQLVWSLVAAALLVRARLPG
ncbi:MAG TPA: hypothetical protein VGD56_15070 [Gemmatirosa sp.]